MRKLLLLAAITLILPRIYAQSSGKILPDATRGISINNPGTQKPQHAAKTTSTTIATETFGTGTDSTLPTGWTAGIIAGPGTWHWTKVASTSAFTMGAMHSLTAANGWMIFDSDSLGDTCLCAPAGWLQSPAYRCDTDTAVQLTFENYYQSLNDSCVVWVSTDPTFATYTRYPVKINNNLPPNGSTANPAIVSINITAAAALQHAVYIRFVYYDEAGHTGGYSWMIDDISLTRLNVYDAALAGSFMYVPDSPAFNSEIFSTPRAFLDSVYPITYVSNWGGKTDSDVIINATIYGSGIVYSKTDTIGVLDYHTTDSEVRFPAFFPNASGTYLCEFHAFFRGDSVSWVNRDTAIFAVTDTTWNVNRGPVTGSYYLYKPGPSPLSYYRGARFDVPPNCIGDTISGFGVEFSASSVPTQGSARVSVQLYSTNQNSPGWTYLGTSVAKPVLLSDISTLTTAVTDFFRIDPFSSGGVSKFVLQPGNTYAAVIQTDSVNTKLLVNATAEPQNLAYTGYFGLYDTSLNNGSPSFNPPHGAGLPWGVPKVKLYFGNNPADYTAIKNVNLENKVGTPYPVPADNNITFPFTLAVNAPVTLIMTNIMGQLVRSKTVEAKAGQQMNITVQVNDLNEGIYIYSVEVDGQRNNGRISIAR